MLNTDGSTVMPPQERMTLKDAYFSGKSLINIIDYHDRFDHIYDLIKHFFHYEDEAKSVFIAYSNGSKFKLDIREITDTDIDVSIFLGKINIPLIYRMEFKWWDKHSVHFSISHPVPDAWTILEGNSYIFVDTLLDNRPWWPS